MSNPTPETPQTDQEEVIEVTEITCEELMARLQNQDEVMIVDMRETWEYQAGHIPTAVNVYIQDIPARLDKFPKDKDIVFQCWQGNTSLGACAFLIENGWPEARLASLQGGIAVWAQTYGPDGLVQD